MKDEAHGYIGYKNFYFNIFESNITYHLQGDTKRIFFTEENYTDFAPVRKQTAKVTTKKCFSVESLVDCFNFRPVPEPVV